MVAAIEKLLVRALDDTEERLSKSGTWRDRVCDLAGHELSRRWPDRYEFDIEAPLVERNRKLVELKNVWHKAE